MVSMHSQVKGGALPISLEPETIRMPQPPPEANSQQITEAGRELADPAGVAASAIRRMSPFWFFLELWDLVRLGTGSGPGGGGQTSLKLMDGRSLAPVCHSCRHITFGSTLAPSWRTGLGPISGPFWRRFWDSFWSSVGAPKLSRRGTRRHTEA